MHPAPERWTAIVNPAAGRRRARARLPRVLDALTSSGLDVEVVVSADADDLVSRACDAFGRERAVVACGGDGTVCALAGVAAEEGGVLGIIPLGSGNDFARQLELPRGDVDAAIEVLRTGQVATVDLGRAHTADGRTTWFTTVANTGFDAVANAWANRITWTSGTPLYVLATLRTLAAYSPTPVRVTVDDTVIETRAWLVAVGNTRTYASGMMITPAASLHDGLLDVCVVGPVSRVEFLRTFPSVFRGAHIEHPEVRIERGAHISVEALDPGPAVDLWASGEHVGPLPARLEPVAGALAVVVPSPGRRLPTPGLPYLTVSVPTMPAARWPVMLQ
jgi:diacylglycerol kinase (ATP)